jgi:hypothetical protein
VRKIVFVSAFFLSLSLLPLEVSAQTSITRPITISLTVGEPLVSPIIPQNWINNFFGDSYEVTLTSDFDGDGHFDYLEYYAGTYPTDGASKLKIAEATLDENDDMEITWFSPTDEEPSRRSYLIFRSGPDGLSALASPNATIQSLDENPDVILINDEGNPVPASLTESTTSYTDSTAGNDLPVFYRVFLFEPNEQTQ